MPYFIIAIILLLLSMQPAYAVDTNRGVLEPAIWLQTSPKLAPYTTSQDMSFSAKQHRYLWLPKGHWLDIDPELLNKFIISAGNTQYIQQRLQVHRDLLCDTKRCQLPALGHNRIVAIQNHLDEGATFSAMIGHVPQDVDSFRRALSLAKPSVVTKNRNGSERYYQLSKDDEVTLFFSAAKKLKLSVRQNMQQPDEKGVIYAYVDKQLIAKINTINSQALEYKEQSLGLENTEYLAIAAGQYLTVKSKTDAFIKLEQSHRAIYDDDVAEKEQEKHLLPYWYQVANDAISEVYHDHSLHVFSDDVFTANNPLATKRHNNLLSMMTGQSQLWGSYRTFSAVETKSSMVSELVEQRLVDDQFYPRINQQFRLISTLNQSAQLFDLSSKKRATPWLTLIAKSTKDSQLKLSSGENSWLVNLKATEDFQSLIISVPLNSQSLTIQSLSSQSNQIEFALYARTLTDLPSDEVIFQQAVNAKNLSPAISKLIADDLHKQHADYLAAIEPYAPARKNVTAFNAEQSLLTAKDLATSAPLDALAFLKPLTQNADTAIAEQAWQLRVAILREQQQFHLANSYLEGLYKSTQQLQLKQFAAQALIDSYQTEHQDIKLFALCAGNLTTIKECQPILINLAVKQQKYRLAAWLAYSSTVPTKVSESFKALNYQTLSAHPFIDEARYQLKAGSQETFINSQGKLQNTVITEAMPWFFTAQTPINLVIKARTAAKQNGEYQTAWLMAESQYQHKLMPIFSDIPATTLFVKNQQAASIAATLVIRLKAGEALKITADHTSYLDVSFIPDSLFSQFDYVSDAANKSPSNDIMSLIYSADATQAELLLNGLYLLSKKRLTNNQYTQLLQRLETLGADSKSTFLQNRIESYGQWQPLDSLLDFAGTRLFDMQSTAQSSFADRFTLLNTQAGSNEGILLRPFHTLNIDLAQTEGQQIRFKFNFSTAELARANVANLSLQLANVQKVWSVTEQQSIPFTFNKRELDNNIISLRWLNPYLSQHLTIEAEQYIAGRWQHLALPTTLLFYTVTPDTPLMAKLPADRLIKLEEMNEFKRTERRFFHPAGKVEVTADKLQYVRLYSWQLSEQSNKISPYSQAKTLLPELITYQAPEQPSIINEQVNLHSDELNWQGFIRYDQQTIFQSAEDIPAREEIDIGARLRLNDDNHWYQLEGYYSLSDTQADIFALNGYHSWQDENSPWYIDTQINSRWQPSHDSFDLQYALDASISIGQSWQRDTVHRHQWQVTPYIRYSSADLDDYLADKQLNSSIFNFYRENHASGWLSYYQYRYQPWVDNYLNFGVASGSNDDWLSLDYLKFNSSWNQYYHGHIFQVGLDSYYRFADDHRATATWQYITRFAWQKQVNLGSFTNGWLKLSWQQDWVWNNHNISVEFSSGNNQHTGFAPFAHDEIIFPALQLNHLLEHSDYEQ